jgi:hypothetical protein
VSHATHLVVPFADLVISLKNGTIGCQGTPQQVTLNPTDENLFGLDLTRDVYDEEVLLIYIPNNFRLKNTIKGNQDRLRLLLEMALFLSKTKEWPLEM